MENFIIKMMNGDKIIVTAKEYSQIINNNGGIVTLTDGTSLNTTRIESAFMESMADQIETKKQQMTGILHDGTRVKRHFGQWVLPEFTYDDNGKEAPVRLDPTYYPEIASDCVPSEQKYHKKYEILPPEKRLDAIMGDIPNSRKRVSDGKTYSIGELLIDKIK